MINESPELTILRYKHIILRSSLIIGFFLIIVFFISYIFGAKESVNFTGGALLGSIFALLNVFALGYASYEFLIKKSSGLYVFWPIGTFLLLTLSALILAIFYEKALLGFALGLTVPLGLGFIVTFLETNPLDHKRL